MCASCGCGKVNEDHGDPRHLTLNDLQEAAQAANIDVQQVVDNLQDAVETGEQVESEQPSRAGGA